MKRNAGQLLKRGLALVLALAALCASARGEGQESTISLSFESAPLDQVLNLYAEWTKRTIIRDPKVDAKITLRGRDLTRRVAFDSL